MRGVFIGANMNTSNHKEQVNLYGLPILYYSSCAVSL